MDRFATPYKNQDDSEAGALEGHVNLLTPAGTPVLGHQVLNKFQIFKIVQSSESFKIN